MCPQIFGVTYMVVAPEYQGLEDLTADAHRSVAAQDSHVFFAEDIPTSIFCVPTPVVRLQSAMGSLCSSPSTVFLARHRAAVSDYVSAAASKSDLERTELSKQKTGVFTGAHVDFTSSIALVHETARGR